jgi:outer membrane protein TolC
MWERSRRTRCRRFAAAALASLVFATIASVAAQEDGRKPELTFASLLDPAEPGTTQECLAVIVGEITQLVGRDYDVRFPADKQWISDWTVEGIRRDLDGLLADPDVDVVLVVGPFSTAALCCYDELPKPVFAPLGVDGDALGLPSKGDSSGVRNLNYLSNPRASFRDLEAFREIAGFDTVYIATDPLIYQVLSQLYERNRLLFEPLGITTIPVSAVSSADEMLGKIPDDAQAVYLTPLLRMPPREMRKLIDGFNDRGIPTMSLLGRVEVEAGVLAGLRAPTDYTRMARRIALNVQQALFGEDPGTFSITFERADRLVINMDTARKIGLYPTWRVLADAELINEDVPTAYTLSLSQAVLNALEANRQILASRRNVAAGEQAVKEVRAGYLPRLDASLGADRINEERAILRADRVSTAGGTLSQVIWSDSLMTSIRAEKDAQRSREEGLVRTELDVAADAATAFLDVLRVQNLERIERDNLRRVEANLDLARNRVKVGYAGPAEIYRWEVARANGKNAVLFAGRQLDAVKARMNQLMFRPQEEPFATEEPDISGDPYLAVGSEELSPFYDNPWSFRVFRSFMVEDGLANSPELKQIDARINAQQRIHRTAKRSFWSPTIGLQGQYDRILEQSADQGPAGLIFPEEEWSIGLTVDLPLFTGGQRLATTRRTREELFGLRDEREDLAEQIELRVRVAMFRIGASWTNIDLSREAATASMKNLDLVTDSYAKGVVSIQDLLDAQNSALTTDLNAANAVYDFLIDLVEVERAAGRLEWFKAEEDRDAWVRRIRDYFEAVRASGVDPGGFE